MAQLLDQYGNPIDLGRLKTVESAPTITGVRQVVSAHPAQGLTPERLARLLLDAETGDPVSYLELAEEMEEKDLHYRSVLGTRKLQVSHLDVTVEAASDDPDHVKDADLVRSVIADGVLDDALYDTLDAVGKGFSVSEIAWDTEGAEWRPARIEWRDPRWFLPSWADGTTMLLKGGPTGLGAPEPLKPFGYVVHRAKSKSGVPIRGGLARPVAWYWLFKNFDIGAWIAFIEAYGQPIRIGKYGPDASKEDRAVLLKAVRNLARDCGGIIPESMAIDLVESKVAGNTTVQQAFADWVDKQVSKAVLGQTGTTDVGQHVGTAKVHDHVRDDIEKEDGRQLAATLSRDLARPLVDLNRGPRPQNRYPRIRIHRPDSIETATLVANVGTFVALGGRVEASWLADKLGIPDPDDGAELLHPAGPAGGPAADPRGDGGDLAVQSQRQESNQDGTDAIDRAVADQLDDEGWMPMVSPIVDQVLQLARSCASAEEFKARLPTLAAGLDTTALADGLNKAMVAARLAGEAEESLDA